MKSHLRFGVGVCLALVAALLLVTFGPAPARAQVQPVNNLISAAQPQNPVPGEGWGKLTNQGLDGPVYAITQLGGDIVVGGNFNGTADGRVTNLNNIALFGNNAWHALPHGGLSSDVRALTVVGGTLYVGGNFSRTADGQVINLNNIARYSGGQWSALPNNGLNGQVNALTSAGGDVFAGGAFRNTSDGSKPMRNIAILRNGAWVPPPQNGLHNTVLAMAAAGADIFLGGLFGSTDTENKPLTHIAELRDAKHWAPLPQNGLNNRVQALYFSRGILSVGGQFTGSQEGPFKAFRFAQYNTRNKTWSYGAPEDTLTAPVLAVGGIGNVIFAGGNFDNRDDNPKAPVRLGRLENGAWSQVANVGVNGTVNALFTVGRTMYVGGGFSATADGKITGMNNIATYTIPE